MKESYSNQGTDERVRSKEIAEKLAHIEEDYNRIDAMKDLLGIVSEGDSADAKADIIRDTEDKLIQNGGSFSGDMNVLRHERQEVTGAVEAKMRQNLIENDVLLDERGRIAPDDSTSTEIADASNRIISGVTHLIDRATSSSFDGQPPFVVKMMELSDETTEKDAKTQQLANRIAFKAIGLHSDQVMNASYEPGGVTNTGWTYETKTLPTEIPGVMYKETYFQPPEGSEKSPVRKASLELGINE